MNLADSERMAGCLEAAGYVCAEDPSDADVLVYNTCSIRDKAEQKVYGALGKQVRALVWRCGALREQHSEGSWAGDVRGRRVPVRWPGRQVA